MDAHVPYSQRHRGADCETNVGRSPWQALETTRSSSKVSGSFFLLLSRFLAMEGDEGKRLSLKKHKGLTSPPSGSILTFSVRTCVRCCCDVAVYLVYFFARVSFFFSVSSVRAEGRRVLYLYQQGLVSISRQLPTPNSIQGPLLL